LDIRHPLSLNQAFLCNPFRFAASTSRKKEGGCEPQPHVRSSPESRRPGTDTAKEPRKATPAVAASELAAVLRCLPVAANMAISRASRSSLSMIAYLQFIVSLHRANRQPSAAAAKPHFQADRWNRRMKLYCPHKAERLY